MPVQPLLLLLLGILLAGLGGEIFVRGVVGLARGARLSPALVAATVAAFATSSPELSVALNAAGAGTPTLALGDALGSNVVNIALILGVVLLLGPMVMSRDSLRRDFPMALAAPGLIAILLLDGALSRLDALLMLGAFTGWLLASVRAAQRQRATTAPEAATAVPPEGWLLLALLLGAGLALLVGAGWCIVGGATALATALGMNPFLVGALVVAAGTSTPELVTAIVARWRGHDEIGLGTMLGSNIFNGLFIVPVATLVAPMTIPVADVAAALLCGLLATIAIHPWGRDRAGFGRGLLLIGLYALYILLLRTPGAS